MINIHNTNTAKCAGVWFRIHLPLTYSSPVWLLMEAGPDTTPGHQIMAPPQNSTVWNDMWSDKHGPIRIGPDRSGWVRYSPV